MDQAKENCSSEKDGDRALASPVSIVGADDTNERNSDVEPTVDLHSTEDQHETVEAKASLKSFCQQFRVIRHKQMDSSTLEIVTAHQDRMQTSHPTVTGNENRNTYRKTGADMRILSAYLRSLNELRPPESIPPEELDKYLCTFFLTVRKTDGSEYEPCSLRAMLASIERYLRQKEYPTSLTRDKEFSSMRNVLKVKQQMLRSLGKGQKSVIAISQAACVREGKISRLFESHEMGPYNPNSIIFSLCFFFCMYLKLRKSTEHKKLLWGDIILCADYNNREYLTFSPQMLNRVHGSARLNHRLSSARVWAEPDIPERDPVSLYKFYAQKRPQSMNQAYAPFYLGLNFLNPLSGQSWYKTAAMGINKLNEMVRQIRDLTGLKSASDTSPSQYLPPNIHDSFGVCSDHSNSRDEHPLEIMSLECKEVTAQTSPQLTIDLDEPGCLEPVDDSTLAEQLTDKPGNSDSGGEVLPKTSHAKGPAWNTGYDSFDSAGNDHFHHMINLHKNCLGQDQLDMMDEEEDDDDGEDDDDDDETDDYIGVEQAKELVVDIIHRMEMSTIPQFDRWLKTMFITRDTVSGQVICQEVRGQGDGGLGLGWNGRLAEEDRNRRDNVGMNILLNISLSPHALHGQGPVTVQARTVQAAEVEMLSAHSSSAPPFTQIARFNRTSEACSAELPPRDGYDYCLSNGYSRDAPLDLAISSTRASSSSHPSSSLKCINKTSLISSSACAGYLSPAKQRKISNHSPTAFLSPLQVHGRSPSGHPIKQGEVREGSSRRKPSPASLTHFKPRVSDNERQGLVPSKCPTSGNEISKFPQVVHLKQEVD